VKVHEKIEGSAFQKHVPEAFFYLPIPDRMDFLTTRLK
jgi:hypothetical protein